MRLRNSKTSIKVKLVVYIVLLVVITVTVTVGPALYFFTDYIYTKAQQQAEQGMNGLYAVLEENKQQALTHASVIAAIPEVIEGIKAKDTQRLLTMTQTLAAQAKVDFVTITDADGNVLIRSHQPDKAGDNIKKQASVAKALTGTPFAALEEGAVVPFAARAGAPVKDEHGNVIGVVSTGYMVGKDEIIDRVKQLYATDVTLFLKDVRYATTIMKDGKRITGTKLNEAIAAIVLDKGQTYVNKAEILGVPYFTAYMPLPGSDGKPIGVVFAGCNIADALAARNQIVFMVAIIVAFVILLAFAATLYMANRITKPLRLLVDNVEKVSKGDLTGGVEIASKDEVGDLSAGFNVMVESLKSLLAQTSGLSRTVALSSQELNEVVSGVNLAARQVSSASAEVTEGTGRQVKAVNEASAIIEQMSAGVDTIANNANAVAGVSDHAAQAAQEGREKISVAVEQMVHIEATVGELAQLVEKLGERSDEIGSIVGTIGALAEQTNLLALNAAIEAAHAGEQGRGFAVVAEEVRKLAEQSRAAVDQVAALVYEVRGDTSQALLAMEQGTKEVKTGTNVVGTAGTVFSKIAGLIEQVSTEVRHISAATQQMASGSKHIVEAVREIDTISADTAVQSETVSTASREQLDAMEEMAATSHSLLSLAQELEKAVNKFRM